MLYNSHVRVIPSKNKDPKKNLYVIDIQRLPNILETPLQNIKVIDDVSLVNFDLDNHNLPKSSFVVASDFFLSELYYSKTSGLLTGSWLDQKISDIENLTIILPFRPFIQEYFSSDYLEKNLVIESITIDQDLGIKISLTVYLTGIDQKVAYNVSQNFLLKEENQISDDFPTVALWPNLPQTSSWQEFFLLVSVLDENGEGYAFQVNVPIDDAEITVRNFEKEQYHYWKSKCRPDILEVVNYEFEPLGIIPLISISFEPDELDCWTVGVDFNLLFTNIAFRKANKATHHFQLRSNLLKITLGSEVKFPEFHDYIYRNFFIPDNLVPFNNTPPMPTTLITRGWHKDLDVIPKIITEARIYNPRSDGEFSSYAITNLQWSNIEYIESFLTQLIRMIAVQSVLKGVKSIDWNISYPSSFSLMRRNIYQDLWERILDELSKISGQNHSLKKIVSEHISFASYFNEILIEPIIHTTGILIQQSTTVLSFWQDNRLIHKAEIFYGERNLLHNLLRFNIDYFDEIFGLNREDLKRLRASLAEDPINFNSILDLRLRMEEGSKKEGDVGKPSLASGYRMNKQKERNRQFRTLLAFAYCGLFHYVGLVQKWLKQERKMTEDYLTSLLLGGNGSRFIHWLSPSGRLQKSSDINELVEGITMSASGLNRNPNLLTVSESPRHEVCSGLVVYCTGDRLIDMPIKTSDNYFLGEVCVINGKKFAPHDRLTLDDEWNETDSKQVCVK